MEISPWCLVLGTLDTRKSTRQVGDNLLSFNAQQHAATSYQIKKTSAFTPPQAMLKICAENLTFEFDNAKWERMLEGGEVEVQPHSSHCNPPMTTAISFDFWGHAEAVLLLIFNRLFSLNQTLILFKGLFISHPDNHGSFTAFVAPEPPAARLHASLRYVTDIPPISTGCHQGAGSTLPSLKIKMCTAGLSQRSFKANLLELITFVFVFDRERVGWRVWGGGALKENMNDGTWRRYKEFEKHKPRERGLLAEIKIAPERKMEK